MRAIRVCSITFPVAVPANFSEDEVLKLLEQQGYTRIHARERERLDVVQDRFRLGSADRAASSRRSKRRCASAAAASMYVLPEGPTASAPPRPHALRVPSDDAPTLAVWRFSTDLHCRRLRHPLPRADAEPVLVQLAARRLRDLPRLRRVIGVDYGLVIPDVGKTLRGRRDPAVADRGQSRVPGRSRQATPASAACRSTCRGAISPAEQQSWVIDGEGDWNKKVWYGVRRFFEWLETRAYKMHIRVLLSKYRSYTPCHVCNGARLKDEALLWRLGTTTMRRASSSPPRAFARRMPSGAMQCMRRCRALRPRSHAAADRAGATSSSARSRCRHRSTRRPTCCSARSAPGSTSSVRVGLGYLTLDRQSRTLSGGEVQRINLTTALGTSLVNTLFVLDEPSIGLHPRDMRRVIEVMHRLRDNGNSLLVVEHDPQIMLAADRILDLGSGSGRARRPDRVRRHARAARRRAPIR